MRSEQSVTLVYLTSISANRAIVRRVETESGYMSNDELLRRDCRILYDDSEVPVRGQRVRIDHRYAFGTAKDVK